MLSILRRRDPTWRFRRRAAAGAVVGIAIVVAPRLAPGLGGWWGQLPGDGGDVGGFPVVSLGALTLGGLLAVAAVDRLLARLGAAVDHTSLTRSYPVPPGRVWWALTDAGAVSRWLMAADDTVVTAGQRFELRGREVGGRRMTLDCQVVAFVPPHRLVLRTVDRRDGDVTTVTWDVSAPDGGTQLQLTHVVDVGRAWWALTTRPRGPAAWFGPRAGSRWRHALDVSLPAVLDVPGSAAGGPTTSS